ncbi:MAG: NAD(P)/FAD-dependent oxidoreductase [Shimia sp.]
MSAAHMLGARHAVTLFEAEPRLGGHARTIFAGASGQPVDTGFLVFNYANYPHLAALFHELAVPVAESDMSFGCSIRGGWLEYGILAPSAVFAQRRNLVRPRFLAMLRDMIRFGKEADRFVTHDDQTVGELIAAMGLGDWFRDYYLLPMSGAIWSTPTERITDFPAHALLTFFRNHGLLSNGGQHDWYTVEGGSVQYVDRLRARLGAAGTELRLGAPVQAVRRVPGGVEVKAPGGGWERFDEVVFATHSDDTLAMLEDARPHEAAALGAVGYQPNEAVTHSDVSLMPRRRAAWASWNYTEDAQTRSDRIDLTYWINRLQNIPGDTQYMVTLNTERAIREDLIHDVKTFRHPVFDAAALAAQEAVRGFNGTDATWFCGAWMKNGFHEDGIGSAVDVVAALEERAAAPIAAQ